MDGYTTDYINLIADNLRDRYDSGFPILKELIQNADDARARTFLFAHHPGFQDAAHPLLQGPGLWFFNDGAFKPSDARALKSFGINSKAGDGSAIGKFGLGMKSVFHLCEAIFYLAWDGEKCHRQGLNPWKQDGQNPHPEWDQDHPGDWDRLEVLAEPLVGDAASWFLLWVPLRRRNQACSARGDDIAIIARYPGDDPKADLAFLDRPDLSLELAKILPLLKHLKRIEHRGEGNAFALELKADQRLLGDQVAESSSGRVVLGPSGQLLCFAGMRRESDPDGAFSTLMKSGAWPRSRYRDEHGQEQQAADKTRPEAAVLFCSGPVPEPRCDLHWAVFLPVEQGGEPLKFAAGSRGHSLILHGQFFIDAGRKKPHALDALHQTPASDGAEPIDDARLRLTWNQHLAQRVLMPLVIPALERYAAVTRLHDAECAALTQALADSQWFRTFRGHVCGSDAWLRATEPGAAPRWTRRSGSDLDRLRPLPSPPNSDLQRPWQVFPRLKSSGLLPFDAGAPSLSNRQPQWHAAELDDLLREVSGLFTDGPRMDYLGDFLERYAGPNLKTEVLQRRLIALLRTGLMTAGREGRRKHAEKSRRLFGFVDSTRRLALATDLPDCALRGIWAINAPILLVPKLEPTLVGDAIPDDETLRDWLQVLDSNLARGISDDEQQAILGASQGLLRTLDTVRRGHFLRVHEELRIIAVRDARTGGKQPVSTADVRAVEKGGTLFGFAGASQDLGLTQRLAGALPVSRVWIVTTNVYRDLFPGTSNLPLVIDGRACLAAIGRDESGRLGSTRERLTLLEHANDPGSDPMARRGLRYLLHGSAAHREADGLPLWFPAHNQHPTWGKLWDQLHGADRWSRVDAGLADAVPRTRSSAVGLREIDARNLLTELAGSGASIPAPTAFDVAEREEILSKIEDRDLWQRLPLHTTITDEPVSASNERVYLAPAGLTPNDPLIREATLIARSGNATVAEQQRRWLKPLDDRARIEIAVNTPECWRYWETIADAFGRLQGEIDRDLKMKLSTTPWLPTRPGDPSAKPEDVIDLTGGLADEVQALVAGHRAVHGACYAVPADLHDGLQAHAAWGLVRTALFSSGESGLDHLGLLLADLPEYHIGQWPTDPRPDVVALLCRCPKLRGWQLLQQASGQPFSFDIAWQKLRTGLVQPLDPERILSVLNWLTQATSDWHVRKDSFDGYLRGLAAHPELARLHLADLRLASRGRKWRSPDALCVDAHGVNPEWLLDKNQQRILGNLIQRADRGPNPATTASTCIPNAEFEQSAKATPQRLADYFRRWRGGLVPTPMIGALTAILGPGEQGQLRAQAEHDLKPHDFTWLLKRLPWTDPGRDGWNLKWMGNRTLTEALDLIKSVVGIVPGDHVNAWNLLGEPMEVPLDQEPQNLLAGPLCWKGGYGVLIQLRAIVPEDHSPARLEDMLRDTAECLYADFYNQKRPDFSLLWRELDRSDQLEIGVARRLILDHIPFYLRQLSSLSAELKRALADCDERRRRVAEAENDERDAGPARQEHANSLEDLVRIIETRQRNSETVLAGVKAKLGQFQYDVGSIPFELFQNADDAVVESNQIAAQSGDGGGVSSRDRRFLVEVGSEYLRFIHWGRPINARGPMEFGGDARGFGRDLEKMLILSASDKDPSQGLTGKFGLGFKTVLLACDRPRILSGRLALEIVAGILPQPWPEVQAARDALTRHGEQTRLPGTLIELPGVSGDAQAKVLARFNGLGGVLCAFGQAIRSIEICGSPQVQAEGQVAKTRGASPRRLTWGPEEICPGVEFGQLSVAGDWGQETGAICLRSEHGALLLALGPDGFRPLPDEIPTLWVSAPTKEQAKLGIAVNGRFAIDAGRAKLAGSSASNLVLARQIGAEAGEALAELLNRSLEDWAAVHKQLRLAADLSSHDFWQRLWLGLTDRWRGRHRDTVAELVRELVLALLRRLSAHPDSIFNGLAEPLRTFTSTGVVRYELAESLAKPAVLDVLGSWAPFTTKYPAVSLVAPDMGAILKHADLAKLAPLGIAALVAVLDPPRVEPEDALVLGHILLLTEGDGNWRSKDLRERLGRLQFRTEEEGWMTTACLLANAGDQIKADECLRYALAPLNRRLHRDYSGITGDDGTALAFFLFCRDGLQADANILAHWILNAHNDDVRRAALIYLAEGERRLEVRERVRGQGWLCDVLQIETLLVTLTAEQRRWIKLLLASDEQIDGIEIPATSQNLPQATISLPEALAELEEWWKKSGPFLGSDYRNRLISSQTDLSIDSGSGLPRDRSAWFELFALGAFQGISRTRDQNHRAFIAYCREKRWWQVFTDIDPKEHPEEWMNIIEEYAEGHHSDEKWTQWIAQFPKLYKLRRWINDYIELFRSIDRFDEPFALEAVLTPQDNSHFQGGGDDPPALNRTLRVGGSLIVRELLQRRILLSPLAMPHAYAPIDRIKRFFGHFGAHVERSEDIFNLLCEHLDTDRAIFNGDYDIPLRIVAAEPGLVPAFRSRLGNFV